MELKDFIGKFAELFDETDADKFQADTKFRELPEWSSMIALSILAMVDEEYDIKLKGDDIRNSQSIADLFEIIKQKA